VTTVSRAQSLTSHNSISACDVYTPLVPPKPTPLPHLNPTIFTLWYVTYFNDCKQVAVRYVQHEQEAEAVVQDVFLRIWADLRQILIPEIPRMYLAGLVRVRALEWLRCREIRTLMRSIPLEQLYDTDETQLQYRVTTQGLSVPEIIENRQLGREIRFAIEQLEAEPRFLLSLLFINGLRHGQIARLTNLPIRAVRMRLRCAIKQVRRSLKEGIHPAEVTSVSDPKPKQFPKRIA
jgi:RNA polymerase sigma factor (sigma-70 family)